MALTARGDRQHDALVGDDPAGTESGAVWQFHDALERGRIARLRRSFGRLSNVRFNVYSTRETELQTALSMGDREVGRLVEATARLGGFRRARKELGFDLRPYVYRRREIDEWLPWDVLDMGMPKSWLVHERDRALGARVTAPCPEVEGCHRCGVC